jgi:predicted acyl esterase
MSYKRIFFLLLAFTLFSSLYCKQDQSKPIFSFLGLSGSSASGIDAEHYIEPAGDDSCIGCPGQLSSAAAENINNQLAQYGIFDAKVDLNVRVTVPKAENPHSDRDIDLWATVIRPGGSVKLPTILIAIPYRREIMGLLYIPLVMSGYNVMAIDIRGTGSSAGEWTSFDLVEQYDIKYVVDKFIPTRVWSDGKVGMIGGSYLGIIQMLTAGLVDTDPQTGEPVHLKAIFPLAPMADPYLDIVMHGGNCDLLFIPLWLGLVDIMGIMPSLLNLGVDGTITQADIDEAEAIWTEHWNAVPANVGWIFDPSHMDKGPFYEKKSSMIYWPDKPKGGWGFPEGSRTIPSSLPVFCVGGWFDIFTRGTCNIYQYGLKKQATTDKKMVIGPYYHLEAALALGINSIMSMKVPARWFDWKIKKKQDPFMEEFPVLLYVMGVDKWRAEKSWPLPESRVEHRTLYLTKHAPSPIWGDWYTNDTTFLQIYANNNYGLSEVKDVSGENPVLKHDVISPIQGLNLHGGNSRSSVRWLMGMEAIGPELSKFYLGKNIDADQWYEDERHDEKECLTFTTEPLEEDTEIVGPLALTFWAKTDFVNPLTQEAIDGIISLIVEAIGIDANNLLSLSLDRKDVQWIAELNDVFPDGRARNITSGWLSAWHRQYDPAGTTSTCTLDGGNVVQHALDPAYVPFDPLYSRPDKSPLAINEGELYQYTIELWPTCNVFKKGHRIRVSLSGSDFPHLLPVIHPSNNTIVIDSAHEARIDFTATNNQNEGSTWKWIGSNKDADKYLLSGGSTGCGSTATASAYQGTTAGIAAEIMGLLAVMMLPLSIIMLQRRIRRKKSV